VPRSAAGYDDLAWGTRPSEVDVDEPEGTTRRRTPPDPGTAVAVTVLILAPIVALLWVGSYAKATPKLWGFPFFYWYQFLWVFLAAGWAAGMIYGTIAAYQQSSATTSHFGSSLDEVPGIGDKGYIALTAVVLNLLVAVVLTFALRAGRAPEGVDATTPDDYHADEGDPRVEPLPELSAR